MSSVPAGRARATTSQSGANSKVSPLSNSRSANPYASTRDGSREKCDCSIRAARLAAVLPTAGSSADSRPTSSDNESAAGKPA